MNVATVHMTAGSVLVVIANDGYAGGTEPLLKFFLNKSEGTIDIGIPANSYIYWTNAITFENVIGASVFDEKENLVFAPWSAIRGTYIEFAVLVPSTMFSFNGLTL